MRAPRGHGLVSEGNRRLLSPREALKHQATCRCGWESPVLDRKGAAVDAYERHIVSVTADIPPQLGLYE